MGLDPGEWTWLDCRPTSSRRNLASSCQRRYRGKHSVALGRGALEELAVQGQSEPKVTGATEAQAAQWHGWLLCSLAGLKHNCSLHVALQLITSEGGGARLQYLKHRRKGAPSLRLLHSFS